MSNRQRLSRANRRMMKFYEQRARQWGERYMLRNWWRIRGMYDRDDIRQDVFGVYLRVYRRHPELGEADLFRIFKRGVQGRVDNRSRQCFPNTHAYVAEQGKLVLELDEALLDAPTTANAETLLEQWSEVIVSLPEDLAEVFRLLTRDFLGVQCIEQRRHRRLSGKDRVEPLNVSIARMLGLDLSRDLLAELNEVITKQRDRV